MFRRKEDGESGVDCSDGGLLFVVPEMEKVGMAELAIQKVRNVVLRRQETWKTDKRRLTQTEWRKKDGKVADRRGQRRTATQ